MSDRNKQREEKQTRQDTKGKEQLKQEGNKLKLNTDNSNFTQRKQNISRNEPKPGKKTETVKQERE